MFKLSLSRWLSPPRVPRRPSLDTELASARLVLRMGAGGDWQAWHALRELSRDYLTPWEPAWPDNGTSSAYFGSLLRRQWRDWRAGRAYAFSIFRREADGQCLTLIGGIALSEVNKDSSGKATVGYWLGQPFAGHGYMSEALALIRDFAFDQLRLKRLEASCMPANAASKKVLARAGFIEERLVPAYLQIAGKSEDHLIFGCAAPAAQARAHTKTATLSGRRFH